jgi:hypothetical protein
MCDADSSTDPSGRSMTSLNAKPGTHGPSVRPVTPA